MRPLDAHVRPAADPAFGGSENDQLAAVMLRKLTLMRRKHAQTREYMEMNALRGIVKDGAVVQQRAA